MPVSTPGYFPPQRGTTGSIVGTTAGARIDPLNPHLFLAGQSAGNDAGVSDLIVIGDHALSSGIAFPGTGSVAIGSQAAKNLTDCSTGDEGGVTVIGYNAGTLLEVGGASVLIGDNVLAQAGAGTAVCAGNVVIGSSAVANMTSDEGASARNITVVGYRALKGVAAAGYDLSSIVAIGDAIGVNVQADITDTVLIGSKCGQFLGSDGVTATLLSTFVGADIAQAEIAGADSCTIIGANACNAGLTTDSSPVNCIGIGAWLKTIGSANNVFIGNFCGVNQGNAVGKLLIEIDNDGSGGNPRSLIYGDFDQGCVLLGQSSVVANVRAFTTQARNVVKIPNGVKASANPVGGGYFYVGAGALHWVGSNGTDTTIANA